MKKKNYLIPILSIAFIGTAAFFIFKSLKIKKEKQKLGDKAAADKAAADKAAADPNTGATNQGVGVFDVLKNIFVQKDAPVNSLYGAISYKDTKAGRNTAETLERLKTYKTN
jgi:hypothetical protein